MTKRSGIDVDEFSTKVRPQDDFFRYVNGVWEEEHVIPDDRSADGSFYTLRDEAEKQVRVIIEEADTDSQIGALYASFMDVDRAAELGTSPLDEDLALIDSATDHASLARVVGALQRSGVTGLVGYYVFADKADPDRNVVYMSQSGLGLPDEAYYREDAHAATREKYVAHIDRMASLTGVAFSAEQVMALETTIASHHWDVVKTREAELTYNPATLTSLAADAPGFDWAGWADAAQVPEAAHELLVVSEPDCFTGIAAAWEATDVGAWKAYLRWRVVNSRAPYLTEEISKANFDFYGTVLSGAPVQRERWKRGVGLVEAVLGELVGQEYVARHFPPDHKRHMDALVANLIEAYRQSITSLEWMTEETRERALDKLGKFTPKIGYPDKWRDYTGLELAADDLVGNVRAASAFEEDWEWNKIGKPVDRSEWLMTPQTVNAYYLPVANEIVFPAAILQPPFFHPSADDAVNYGGIGSVIGHEIGHGFDDQGSKYDGTGKLDDWWTEADRTAFTERTSVLISQYDGYSPAQLSDDHRVIGALTIGENIGDLAGVEIALKAYAIALGHPIEEAPELGGLTALQRFFVGYALTERMKVRDEALITRLNTDPHSPSEFRVNGIVRNMNAWYEAFEVGADDALWLDPAERVSIW
ncbi:M13 family metallopeptidase [Demequina zhanjiangensis]|uniref:M13-type metalloendopeptidase n=1 Tax=Demequina zhanjiangensis TaxID=3051659 RepID=A0ABT8G1H7_9MICO|nr:M13-type metalloendopeptidase [Demequina sp. SYSU T00b26]MDN4472993.1 M13-type metalloendopeptidase [Demequina sp. SYSU T00b26]